MALLNTGSFQWIIIPVNAATTNTWAVGPELAYHHQLSPLFSIGVAVDFLWVASSTANAEGITSSGPVTVPGFTLGSLDLEFGFHF